MHFIINYLVAKGDREPNDDGDAAAADDDDAAAADDAADDDDDDDDDDAAAGKKQVAGAGVPVSGRVRGDGDNETSGGPGVTGVVLQS